MNNHICGLVVLVRLRKDKTQYGKRSHIILHTDKHSQASPLCATSTNHLSTPTACSRETAHANPTHVKGKCRTGLLGKASSQSQSLFIGSDLCTGVTRVSCIAL